MEIKYAYTIVKILYQCCYVDEMNCVYEYQSLLSCHAMLYHNVPSDHHSQTVKWHMRKLIMHC